eukprot:ctg_564.g323
MRGTQRSDRHAGAGGAGGRGHPTTHRVPLPLPDPHRYRPHAHCAPFERAGDGPCVASRGRHHHGRRAGVARSSPTRRYAARRECRRRILDADRCAGGAQRTRPVRHRRGAGRSAGVSARCRARRFPSGHAHFHALHGSVGAVDGCERGVAASATETRPTHAGHGSGAAATTTPAAQRSVAGGATGARHGTGAVRPADAGGASAGAHVPGITDRAAAVRVCRRAGARSGGGGRHRRAVLGRVSVRLAAISGGADRSAHLVECAHGASALCGEVARGDHAAIGGSRRGARHVRRWHTVPRATADACRADGPCTHRCVGGRTVGAAVGVRRRAMARGGRGGCATGGCRRTAVASARVSCPLGGATSGRSRGRGEGGGIGDAPPKRHRCDDCRRARGVASSGPASGAARASVSLRTGVPGADRHAHRARAHSVSPADRTAARTGVACAAHARMALRGGGGADARPGDGAGDGGGGSGRRAPPQRQTSSARRGPDADYPPPSGKHSQAAAAPTNPPPSPASCLLSVTLFGRIFDHLLHAHFPPLTFQVHDDALAVAVDAGAVDTVLARRTGDALAGGLVERRAVADAAHRATGALAVGARGPVRLAAGDEARRA